MILIVAALSCPIVGRVDGDSRVIHRVTLEGLPIAAWETAPNATAVCGAKVKLDAHVDGNPVRWRDVRTRGTRMTRCPACNPRASRATVTA
jgi:hypothetical protein